MQQAVPQLKSEGAVGNRLIVELGTNGPFTRGRADLLLDSLGPVTAVVLVNTHVPRPWQQAGQRQHRRRGPELPEHGDGRLEHRSAPPPRSTSIPTASISNPTGAKFYAVTRWSGTAALPAASATDQTMATPLATAHTSGHG